MNYYPFHIGDYASHTAHLEPFEDLAYRRMIDLYYLREAPLPADKQEIARLIRMRQHIQEIESVLNEFFALTDDGWTNERCDNELMRMLEKQAKAKASAELSVKARQAKAQQKISEGSTNAQRTLNERLTDVELPTPTPTPTPSIKNNRSRSGAPVVCPEDVDSQTWTDWLAIRKAKRAPLTKTALDGLVREAAKAGLSTNQAIKMCAERGWQSFKAEWVDRKTPLKGFELGDAIGREWLMEQGEGNGFLE